MCGINGIFAYLDSAPAVSADELRTTRDHMTARGPDGRGGWLSSNHRIGLGHRRLAIIDLSDAAAQPMASADGRYQLVFNGEIYNYRALRQQLQAAGCAFRTNSDTEVLLHLYARQGPAMLPALRGMFAFALWDSAERQLFLARDPYGIKPLYYADTGGVLRFASQVKALQAGGALSREVDPAGQVGFYLFGSVPEPFTWYRDIRALAAGHSFSVDACGPSEPRAYHRIAEIYRQAELSITGEDRGPNAKTATGAAAAQQQQVQTRLREALLGSVRHHLEADVPVGAFLSAGIDSGALVGLMRDAGANDIQTLTLSFDEFQGRPDDEAPLAAEVARRYGTRHHSRRVTEQEFRDDLPRILTAMDQPSIDGINTWFVAKAAHECGLKVAVSGLGGDELLGGYPSFTDIPRWVRWLGPMTRLPGFGRTLRSIGTRVTAAHSGLSPKLPGMVEYGGTYPGAYLLRRGLYMPWELERLIDPDRLSEGLRRISPLGMIATQLQPCPHSAFARVATLESTLYMRNQLLRDTDWASMAHSLEIRVPMVDAQLLAEVAPLTLSTHGQTGSQSQAAKRWLARAPSQPLPTIVLDRPKTGFGTPLSRWLTNQRSSAATVPVTYAYSRVWALHVARP
jgi:asparagine synthase (glutamine-hydrolysing)